MGTLFHPQIVTANSLQDGNTVYLDRSRHWVGNYRAARIARTPEVAAELLVRALGDAAIVVGPRLIEVDLGDEGEPYPRAFRERARIIGPSVGPIRF